MEAVRVPLEPAAVLTRAFPGERCPAALYWPWIHGLRRKLRRARLIANDHVFGVRWTGAMIEERLFRLVAQLPDGISEIYCHPAVASTPVLAAAQPGYRHAEEYAALLSPRLKARIAELGVKLITYAELATTPAGTKPAGGR
jgi:chitin disaccharide deacetylase